MQPPCITAVSKWNNPPRWGVLCVCVCGGGGGQYFNGKVQHTHTLWVLQALRQVEVQNYFEVFCFLDIFGHVSMQLNCTRFEIVQKRICSAHIYIYIYKFAVYWAVHWQLSMVGVIFGTEGFCANLTDFSQKCEEKINEPTIKPLLTLGTPVISLWIHASEKSLCVILSRYSNSAVFKHDWISTVGKNAAFRFTGFSGTRGTLGQNSASLLTIPMH